MSVKAKFKCDSVTKHDSPTDPSVVVEMSAVIAYNEADGSYNGENASWSKWTPSGRLSMGITNPACFDQFEAGKEYYLTIEPVPEVAADDAGGSNPPGPGQPGKP